MSIFGKIFKGAKQKINIKGLVSGVGAQSILGGKETAGGSSGLFGSLFGKKKQKEAVLENAQYQIPTASQAQDKTMMYLGLGALGLMAFYLLTKKK
jgi:hypothetical protein